MNENFEYENVEFWMWNGEYKYEWRNMHGISLNHEGTENEYEWRPKTKLFALDTWFLWKKVRTSNVTKQDE